MTYKKITILLLAIGTLVPNFLTAQNKNRIAIQTGLFHATFDNTPLFNNKRTIENSRIRYPSGYFGGYLNESLGIIYERKIINNSSLSLEYMSQRAWFRNDMNAFTTNDKGPYLVSKMIKKINIGYNRRIRLSSKIDFMYGAGVDYIWGQEAVYLYSSPGDWWYYSDFRRINRNDLGFNIRTGIEFSPIKRITLYTNFDFLGIAFLNAKDLEGNDSFSFFKEKYGIDYLPSRWDISWQFGIGFNFN